MVTPVESQHSDSMASFAPTRHFIRVSLACVQCRSRHLKCDAKAPRCSRCQTDGKQCTYLKSRRGGRRRPTSSPSPVPADLPLSGLPPDCVSLPVPDENVFNDAYCGVPRSIPMVTPTRATTIASSNGSSPTHSEVQSDDLLNMYYRYFHISHPCVLPRWSFQIRLAQDPVTLRPLLLTMQYIGALFTPSVNSGPLEAEVQKAFADFRAGSGEPTGYHVQAFLLYSIAVYWCNEIERGLKILDETIRMALDMEMHLESFAQRHGENNRLLEESWRRTWWQLYVVDGHVAGSTHTFPFRTSHIQPTATLPCEEDLYEKGDIPKPRTLYEYDMREFADEEDQDFSSFAHLVGLTRGLDLALSGRRPNNPDPPSVVCSRVDTCMRAWCSLIPPRKRCLAREDGTIDEQLFKANMLVHTYIVDLHRELSSLAYSPIESVSRCAPPAPSDANNPNRATKDMQIHTSKVLLAVDKFNDLLTLPTTIISHTPFVICMIANTTIAHLSACKHLFRGKTLQIERERIRLNMGALKTLSMYWPLGKRTYREMATIARDILSLSDGDISPISNAAMMPNTTSHGVVMPHGPPASYPDVLSFDFNGIFDVGDLFDKSISYDYTALSLPSSLTQDVS
ncbi:putative C6 transcription factor [Arthroderma uncinatum]|uniref:putative C6 transcription factor n=1 Tax=Arthroderma uncinatum TaxID=74035 RepID=UPI00144A4F17|nr:putative C6 transcription factor [Arthroderma uncinatum]KAF3479920.1 putative C6 transcription factor [Arthroderma uncinatum]